MNSLYDTNSKGISYTGGFFMLIGFTIISLLLAAVISLPIWTAMTGKGLEAMQKEIGDPANSDAVKVMQVISTVIGFLIPAIFTAYLLNRKPLQLIGFTGKIKLIQISLVFAIVIAALFFSGFLSYVNERLPISEALKLKFTRMENDYNENVEAILGLNSVGQYILALIIMAFLPALCEETLFRGGLQNFLTRSTKKPWLSIIIVSILFSAAHFSYFGFLSRFFLGIMLGLLYQYSGRIWLNILAHFLNNAAAITVLYVFKLQGRSLKDAIDDSPSTYWGVLALPILIGLLILFRKQSVQPKELPVTSSFTFEENQEPPPHGV